MDRYLEHGVTIESRWLVMRSLGVALSALLVAERLPLALGSARPFVAGAIAVFAYAMPSEIARSLASNDP